MGIEVRPLGVACNIACQYCYQNPIRDAGNVAARYDLEAIKAAVLKEGGSFILFGGEPLLVPKKDLEHLWAWGLERFKSNGIQTNGTLIDDDHIELFKKYKVHVGISIDGPGWLNDVRWAGSLERTRSHTAVAEEAIERLCREGIPPSLIVTLHSGNATADKLPAMHDWFRRLDRMGVTSARLHVLEVETEDVRGQYALSTEENLAALLSFVDLEGELVSLSLDLFRDMENLLVGSDRNTTCVWNACDPQNTAAVRGVEGFGQRSNCGRVNKDGVDAQKADRMSYERYLSLYATPQEYGGCSGCRFFLMCKGQCPGTAIDGDWRNRTEHCDLWKRVFEHLERRVMARGVVPLSLATDRASIEQNVIRGWESSTNNCVASALETVRGGRR